MTYNVLSGTLSLYTTYYFSISPSFPFILPVIPPLGLAERRNTPSKVRSIAPVANAF